MRREVTDLEMNQVTGGTVKRITVNTNDLKLRKNQPVTATTAILRSTNTITNTTLALHGTSGSSINRKITGAC